MYDRKQVARANDYWNNKNERAKVALAHTKMMQRQYSENIKYSAAHSRFYSEFFEFPSLNPAEKRIPKIQLVPCTTVEALFMVDHPIKSTAILNFASFKHPGGMFLKGSAAQEESLCHSSYLYNVLDMFSSTYYENNQANTNNSLYYNRAIFSPNVLFFQNDANGVCHTTFTNVITCAAPNKSAAMKYSAISEQQVSDSLKARCKFVLDIAAYNRVNNLVLGAFGCGVFGNDPGEVAAIFRTLLESGEYTFDEVIFAIPTTGHSIDNYIAFKFVFELEPIKPNNTANCNGCNRLAAIGQELEDSFYNSQVRGV